MTGQASHERIAVSLVTGFLGSGKTTLIAALLKQPAMAGTAVIVNEFGAVGIDDAIFAQSLAADNVVLLANGCLCCTAGDDLSARVWSLARRADGRPRRIVIETTGLADPMPVLRRLMSDPRLTQATRLDAVVATIDAVNGLKNLDDHPVAVAPVCGRRPARHHQDRSRRGRRRRGARRAASRAQSRRRHSRSGAWAHRCAASFSAPRSPTPASGKPDIDRWLGLAAPP